MTEDKDKVADRRDQGRGIASFADGLVVVGTLGPPTSSRYEVATISGDDLAGAPGT